MKTFSFHRPRRLEEALVLIEKYEGETTAILSGGTDLLVMMKHESLAPRHLVNIKEIPGLREIRREGGGFAIGSAATLSEVAEHQEIRKGYPALVQAIGKIASPQIRNRATIGGNVCLDTKCLFLNRTIDARRSRPDCLKEGGRICNIVLGAKRCFSVFSADSVPALIVLNAKVRIFGSSGTRLVPVEDIYSGDGVKPLKLAKEIVTEILLPPPAPFSLYLKERWRQSLDFPIVGLAMATLPDSTGRKCEDVKMALTGVTGFPPRLEKAESVFKGKAIEALQDKEELSGSIKEALRAAHPISPMGGLGNYRRVQVGVLLEQAASQLFRQIEAGRKKGA